MLFGIEPPPPPAPVVVERRVIRPAEVTTERRRFKPEARPTKAQVLRIIAFEAAKWGASEARLVCRVKGESTFRWWEVNGQYQGLGQFAQETFSRGFASIGTRRVVERTTRTRHKRTRILWFYSDGSRGIEYGRKNRQTVVTLRRGTIPAKVERTHGYAQLRIMARSMVGLGGVRDGEWQVRC